MRIAGIGETLIQREPAAQRPANGAFGEVFEKMIDSVNDSQIKATQAVKDFALGKIENAHDLILAEVEADTSFRMLAQTRNKLVEAYKEIMRMQI